MDIHHLKIFTTVYSCGSFTRASKRLAISQPTISEHVKNLEKELGFILFDRLGRTIKPTERAMELFPRALKLIDDLDSLENELKHGKTSLAGDLTIGASTIPGEYILPRIAADFRGKNRQVRFNVIVHDSGKITRMVLAHQVIIGIVGSRIEHDSLDFQPIFSDQLVVAAPAGADFPDRMDLATFRTLPLICREEGSGTRESVSRILSSHGIDIATLPRVASLGSSTAVKEAIKSGLGVSVISSLAVQDELEQGRLKLIDVEGINLQRDFYLVTHRRRTLPALYQAFIDEIRYSPSDSASSDDRPDLRTT